MLVSPVRRRSHREQRNDTHSPVRRRSQRERRDDMMHTVQSCCMSLVLAGDSQQGNDRTLSRKFTNNFFGHPSPREREKKGGLFHKANKALILIVSIVGKGELRVRMKFSTHLRLRSHRYRTMDR